MAQQARKRESLFLPSRLLAGDVSPDVMRAHTVADTLRTVARHCEIAWDNDARAAIAKELGMPEMWLEAALGDIRDTPTVSLELLHEWREWFERIAPKEEE